jgi:peptidoglycan-associated lipoprotein
MSQGSSQVSSGNITPKVLGPQRDAKEVMLLSGLVLFVVGTLATIWYVSQPKEQSKVTGSTEQVNVQDLFKKATAMNQAEASPTNSTKVVPPAPSISDIIHTDIYFEVGRKGLTDEAKVQLAMQADMLKQHEEYGVLIQGYTDQQGSASYNMQLGMKRAETVKAELVNAGIAEHRIKTVSLGEEGVLCVDSSDVCRHMNRRVHLEVRKIGQEHMAIPAAPAISSDLPETTIAPSSTLGEGGTTRESLPPTWSEPTLIPEPAKGK